MNCPHCDEPMQIFHGTRSGEVCFTCNHWEMEPTEQELELKRLQKENAELRSAIEKLQDHIPKTTQIQRAEMLRQVRDQTSGPGHELLRQILMDLDAVEALVSGLSEEQSDVPRPV